MSLTDKDIEKLDWKSEYGATLETHEVLEVLAKIAEDPQAYTETVLDAGYTRAEQLANALNGMMGGLRAAEIAKTFKRAVKAREACEKYDLVPRATLEHAQAQLRPAVAINSATMAPKSFGAAKNLLISAAEHALLEKGGDAFAACRLVLKTLKEMDCENCTASIGPGEPLPPPPPPTKLGNHPLAPAYFYAARCPKAAAETPFVELDEDVKARWRAETARYNADHFACSWPKP